VNIETKKVKLSQIKLNPDNPRRISEKDMDRLVNSLTEFPEMMHIIEPLSKPYPKRDKQAIGGDHPHSGGAAPTVTLQTKRPKQAMASDQEAQRQGSADPDAPIITEAPNGN